MRSVLIVRPGALGDALLSLPLIEALLARGVERIHLLGTPASWEFLRRPTAPLEVHDLGGRDWLGLFGGERGLAPRARSLLGTIDTALVLLGRGRERVEQALSAAGVARVLGAAPAAVGTMPQASGSASWPAPWPPQKGHAAERLMRVLPEAHSSDWPAAPPTLAEHPLLRPEAAAPPREDIVVLHPGSGGAAKCWPVANFARLARQTEQLGLKPLFLIGPADGTLWSELGGLLPPALAASALVERPLRELLALFARARAYVGNDSGISHLAGRACPSLVLFGPSDARVWHPLGPRVVILSAPGGALARLGVEAVEAALSSLLAG